MHRKIRFSDKESPTQSRRVSVCDHSMKEPSHFASWAGLATTEAGLTGPSARSDNSMKVMAGDADRKVDDSEGEGTGDGDREDRGRMRRFGPDCRDHLDPEPLEQLSTVT
jgi:hypothetical protein